MTQKRYCNFDSCSTKSLHNSKLPDYLNLIWFYYHPSHSFHVGPHHGGSEIMSGTRLCIANLCGQAAYFCAIFCDLVAYFCANLCGQAAYFCLIFMWFDRIFLWGIYLMIQTAYIAYFTPNAPCWTTELKCESHFVSGLDHSSLLLW